MNPFSVFDPATGSIVRNVSTSTTYIEGIYDASKEDYVEGFYDLNLYYIDTSSRQPALLPSKPSAWHVFDFVTKQWIDPRTLEQVQTMTWGAMKSLRAQKEFAGFTWDGSVFDSDQTSQSRIMGAVQLAGMSPAFEVPWTLKDNTVRVLSAGDTVAVGAALGTHIAAIFARAQELRLEIYAATTIPAVEAITWDAP